MLYPVLLSGGSGKRLWPASRQDLPKQLINLYNEESLLQNTLKNLAHFPDHHPPILVVNQKHSDVVDKQLKSADLENIDIIYEPEGRNTAPAITLAALCAQEEDPDAMLLAMPIDHCFIELSPLIEAINDVQDIAEKGYLVAFGIEAESPKTDFGYIKADKAIGKAFTIEQFLEKPNSQKAKEFCDCGNYYWNAGIFLFRASAMLDEMKKLCPDIHQCCCDAWKKSRQGGNRHYIDATEFCQCRDISIDYAIMENTDHSAVIPTSVKWHDIGNWKALYDYLPKDADFNVLTGDVVNHHCQRSYLRSENRLVAAVGLEDCAVIETKDAVLVASMEHVNELSVFVTSLLDKKRTEACEATTHYYSWGHCHAIEKSEQLQIQKIIVNPQQAIPYYSNDCNKYIIILTGEAKVEKAKSITTLSEKETVLLNKGEECQIQNMNQSELVFLEIDIK